jgi:hypothetical protein
VNLQCSQLLAATEGRPTVPLRIQVENWFAQVELAAMRSWQAQFPGSQFWAANGLRQPEKISRITRYSLVWTAEGVVDTARSTFTNRIGSMPAAAVV